MDSATLSKEKRQLTIKTGVLKRLTKEEKSYIKEAEEQKERIEQYTREGKDEWHISKQKEVLQDSLKMIPDCKKRLEAALEDLKALVEASSSTPELASSEEFKEAQKVIQSVDSSTDYTSQVASQIASA